MVEALTVLIWAEINTLFNFLKMYQITMYNLILPAEICTLHVLDLLPLRNAILFTASFSLAF